MTFWTDDRIEVLRTLWLGGNSASSIGDMMGLTKGAVMGKIHRLGIQRGTRKPDPIAKRPKRAPHMREADRRARLVLSAPQDEAQEPKTDPETPFEPGTEKGIPAAVVGLHSRQCCYLIGDGRDRHFCDRHKIDGSSYCAAHKSICISGYFTPSKRPARSPIDFRRYE